MKKIIMLGLLLCANCIRVDAQVVDTVAIVHEADSLRKVALSFYNASNFKEGLPIQIRAVELIKAKLGEKHDSYGRQTNTLGRFYFQLGEYNKAEYYYLISKEIYAIKPGIKSKDYSIVLSNLAAVYHETGDDDKAETFSLEFTEIRKQLFGKQSTEYAWSVGNLGNLYLAQEEYNKAEKMYEEALEIYRNMGKEEDFAKSHMYLGNLYKAMGEHAKAELHLLKCLEILDSLNKTETSLYAYLLTSLGIFYEENGYFDKAESFYFKSLNLKGTLFGKDGLDYAATVAALAILYSNKGESDKAESFYLKALEIYKFKSGIYNKDYIATLISIGAFYTLYSPGKADSFLLEAKNILEKSDNINSYMYCATLQNLGELYSSKKDFVTAEHFLKDAQKCDEETNLNKQKFDYTTLLTSLAINYQEEHQFDKATNYFREANEKSQTLIQKSARYCSEKEMLEYLNKFKDQRAALLLSALNKSAEGLSSIAYNNTLFQKGFLFNSLLQLRSKAKRDTLIAKKYADFEDMNRHLAAEYSKPIDRQKNLSKYQEKANDLEKDLARTAAGFKEAEHQVKWQELQTALKPGDVALEFVDFKAKIFEANDSILYGVLLLRPIDTIPQFIPLFEEKELTPLLKGATGGNNYLKINALYAQKMNPSKQKSLYELIWLPLENALKGSKTVYYAPSGLLHRINLAAIPNQTGQTFGDRFQLVEVGSTRQLVVPINSTSTTTNNAYLAGGIRYESDSTSIAYASRGASSRSIEPDAQLPFQPDSLSIARGGVLDYLPATAAEVRDIAQTLSTAGIRAQVDTGFYATEASFRQLGVGTPSPRIIHLATHGYFFPDPVKKDQKSFGGLGQEPVFKISEHPMIRSGLIMAGAKQAWLTGKHPEGQEDGILTAYEISQMNLSGTELVVLSACETGLGDIVGNEGVFGLQRAFKISGAKYLIMSLWKVDDQSTKDFMTTFYKHWLTEKQTVPEAFQNTQHAMRGKRPGAYDWAGFVLIE